MFNDLDCNQDKRLSQNELANVSYRPQDDLTHYRAISPDVFTFYDTNRDGALTQTEFADLVRGVRWTAYQVPGGRPCGHQP